MAQALSDPFGIREGLTSTSSLLQTGGRQRAGKALGLYTFDIEFVTLYNMEVLFQISSEDTRFHLLLLAVSFFPFPRFQISIDPLTQTSLLRTLESNSVPHPAQARGKNQQ